VGDAEARRVDFAGWYSVGEPDVGNIRPHDPVFTALIPALRARGFMQGEIDQIFVTNPAAAFAVRVRITRGRG